MKKLDNKGFTLVEVLAVLVILVVIMSIAIPNISSSLERSKGKQDTARIDVLEAYAELYVADNKNTIYNNLKNAGTDKCYIELNKLEGYASEDELKDSDGNAFEGVIIFSRDNNDYQYSDDKRYMIDDENFEDVTIAC